MPCSTCTATPTTTGRSSPWPVRAHGSRTPCGPWPGPRWRTSTSGRHAASIPGWGRSTSCPSSPSSPGRAAAWAGEVRPHPGARRAPPLRGRGPAEELEPALLLLRPRADPARGPARRLRPLEPDTGPAGPTPAPGPAPSGPVTSWWPTTCGSTTADVAVARAVAAAVRGPDVRALGLATGGATQVSCNLVDPFVVGPAQVYDAVRPPGRAGRHTRGAGRARRSGTGRGGRRRPRRRVEGARPRPRAHHRGAPGSDPVPPEGVRPPAQEAEARYEADAVSAARRLMARPGAAVDARARRARPRSRTSRRWPSAYSRQSSRTTHPRQTSLASRVDAPRSGKNRSGSTPMQFALDCQSRSWRPYSSETMSTGTPPLAI